MGLPNKINKAVPAGSDGPETLDNSIRDFKLAMQDFLGLPDNSNIAAPGASYSASGMIAALFVSVAASATQAGELRFVDGKFQGYNGSSVVVFADTASTVGATGALLQFVSSIYTSQETISTVIPLDNTIPQNTEGDQVMALAVTPANSNNTLIIDVGVSVNSTGEDITIMSLCQDSTANALSATVTHHDSSSKPSTMSIRYTMLAGTTSATTFKVRIGPNSSGDRYLNGTTTRFFGGVCNSYMTIAEISA